jgi:hypothetical protein
MIPEPVPAPHSERIHHEPDELTERQSPALTPDRAARFWARINATDGDDMIGALTKTLGFRPAARTGRQRLGGCVQPYESIPSASRIGETEIEWATLRWVLGEGESFAGRTPTPLRARGRTYRVVDNPYRCAIVHPVSPGVAHLSHARPLPG